VSERQTPVSTDPNIVYILDQAKAADSARGALAERIRKTLGAGTTT
jgi:hypothetical protein